MSAFEMLTTLDPVARALHTAHSKGVIHRDVKPGNIFLIGLEVGGGVRLLDFGVSKIYQAEELLQVPELDGTPSYIAPELWRAEPFDHRIDVYALASVVFRVLAAKPPFVAKAAPELLEMVTTSPRPKLTAIRPELPADIDEWVARGLAVTRDERYPYVSSMWNDLISILMKGESASAEKTRATFRLPQG
jgi:serine/threonine-protein kinase